MARSDTASPRNSLLISPEELAKALRDSTAGGSDALTGWVVVDCRFDLLHPEAGRDAYRQGHVPGAWYADLDGDLSAPRTSESGRHPLPDPSRLRTLFGRFGITAASRVVVYDDGAGAVALRLWWLLRWMGHHNVSLLEGGFGAWQKAGLPVSRDLPQTPPVNFVGEPGKMPVLNTRDIVAGLASGSIRLLDVRAEGRFLGRAEPIDPVAGHIPGAVNAPFSGNLAAGNCFQPDGQLARRYGPLVDGYKAGSVAFMCGSGVTACHGIFALELAGLPGAALYPGLVERVDPLTRATGGYGMNVRRENAILWSLLALPALAACTGTGSGAGPEKAPIPPPSATGSADCFYPREIQSFHVLDRSNLVVYGSGESRAFHVRISPPSIDLRNAERLAFVPSAGRICGYAGERLVVAPASSGPPLAVIGVARLSPESLESLRSGDGAGAGLQPRPQPGAGPDIEGITEPEDPGPGSGGSSK